MIEIEICKHCGKEIKKLDNLQTWVHVDTGLIECHPDTDAEPDKEYCQAKLSINGVQYHCELVNGHTGVHELEFQSSVLTPQGFIPNQYKIKW